MIRYALACDDGHEFESWFPSSASYDAQAAGGFVSCPVCGSAGVEKRIMAPSLGRKGASAKGASAKEAQVGELLSAPNESGPAPALPVPAPQPMALMSERDMAIRAMMRAVREHVTKTADYVGPTFADEARKMHYGDIEHRSIYGESTPDYTRALIEEGIEIHPLPMMPDERN